MNANISEFSLRDKRFADYIARRTADNLQALSPAVFDAFGPYSWEVYVNLPPGGHEIPRLRIRYQAPGLLVMQWIVPNGMILDTQYFHKQQTEET